ncbi:hypothetical protein [Saccharolobus caldissimus]|uniref:Uncharacterized protein n=1 Tax=Saccharolobus caldissimus TaxID=1702097 RepID=A0AAQ4CQ47_9CREN|nr:hypothetical protein [Saccharolobus caldissimus]BDB97928.1 hypothetical protein SACC_09450 [Saccharolobus caldissimus]
MYKHEINDEETLEILETVFDIYYTCGIAKSYTAVVELAINEMTKKSKISMRRLLICTSRKFMSYLTFPYMRRWKNEGRALLIKSEFVKDEFKVNEWKEYPEISQYVDKRLVEVTPFRITETPVTKNLILSDEAKEILLLFKEKYKMETVDDALLTILAKTKAMQFVTFLTRLIYDVVTKEELDEMFGNFGSFYYVFAFERDDSYIKIVHEFFPYVYNIEFVKHVR